MIMDMNMNVLRRDASTVDPKQAARMTRFWGDESWRGLAYESGGLFGWPEKVSNEKFMEAYRKRLREVAGFAYVAHPLPMQNRNNATIYYLFFASPNKTGHDIVEEIFEKYRKRG